MATATVSAPSITALADELCAVTSGVRQRAAQLAEDIYNAATGDMGPRSDEVERLCYPLGEEARALAAQWRGGDEWQGADFFNEMAEDAANLRDLVRLATS